MHRTLSAAALAAVLFVPAMAQPAFLTVSATAPTGSGLYQKKAINVPFADVDLGTPQGAAALLDRIDAASRAVCGERADRPMDVVRARVFAACHKQTVAAAVEAVNAPVLTQFAATR